MTAIKQHLFPFPCLSEYFHFGQIGSQFLRCVFHNFLLHVFQEGIQSESKHSRDTMWLEQKGLGCIFDQGRIQEFQNGGGGGGGPRGEDF